MIKNILLFLALVCLPALSFATHLRAGEITAKRISSTDLTYKITLTTYTDEKNGKVANDGQDIVDFYFGFTTNKIESAKVQRKKKFLINPYTVCNVYDTTFTYPSAGTYTISCGIENRNINTVNLISDEGGSSDGISFFVRTTIVINASTGMNSTPVLLNIPIDSAAVGQRFIHNPGAYDIDGDSLAYRLAVCLENSKARPGAGVDIPGYLSPTTLGTSPILNELGTGPATFTINSSTGDLIWDVPRLKGQYNVAFIVEEWRKAPDGSSIKIGEVERDMQIIVVETDNHRPILSVPPDVCIEAGKKVSFDVTATDQDNQAVTLTSNSGVYNLTATGTNFDYVAAQAATIAITNGIGKAKASFSWNTNCKHVRDQAYDVLFKVVDTPPRNSTQLSDIKTVKIKILPPRPSSLQAQEITTGGVSLKWSPVVNCNDSTQILIYRKNGCSSQNPGTCTQGMPSDWGYTLIATVSNRDSTFIDKTAQAGGTYSYRLISKMQISTFITMKSAPSAEFCVGNVLKQGSSIITNVSVLTTDMATGSINVRWTRPFEFDVTKTKAPYYYKLYRAEGINSEAFKLINSTTTNLGINADTVFVDNGLNTKTIVYRYKVEFYSDSSKLVGTSAAASAVKLNVVTNDKSLNLNWGASVPWVNDNHYHFIYRESKTTPGQFNLIKKLKVSNSGTYSYVDSGKDFELADGDISYTMQNGETVCYKVLTIGNYGQLAKLDSLVNASEIGCGTPADNTPPCSPDVSSSTVTGTSSCDKLSQKDFCDESVFVNTITWANPNATTGTTACRQDIASYKIYYARYKDDVPTIIGTHDASQTNTFTHRRNSKDGFAGCYYITSVSSLGKESAMSNKICFDNCEKISFPNVFTPNNDGSNDTFTPMNCVAFVNTISYEIYNTAGLKIASNSGTTMQWDGTNSSGVEMPSGQYYYLVNVLFERLDKAGSSKTFKGWVSLIR